MLTSGAASIVLLFVFLEVSAFLLPSGIGTINKGKGIRATYWLLSDDAVFLGGWSHSHQLLCLRLLALVGSCAWGHDFGDISEGELLGVIVYLRMI